MSRPASVRLQGLTWRPLGSRDPILAGIELVIAPGERLLVTGPSGGGKSTLLKALAGVLTTTEPGELTGTVAVNDGPPRGGDVGLLIQDPGDALIAPTAGRDVAFGLENRGVPRRQIPERIEAALAAVGFPYGPERATRALSGGEAQRLALAGVIVSAPGLLLLDEPTAMLDPDAAARVRAAVAGVTAQRTSTLVVVEQRLEGWVDLVDRLVVIAGGRIAADGPVSQVLASAGLLDHGVWVPASPPPRLLTVAEALATPHSRHPARTTLVTTSDLTVTLRPPNGLRIAQNGRPRTMAVQDVTLGISSGRTLAVVGRSGAGKSTLLRACVGLARPTSGNVIATPPLARSAGRAPHRWTSRELAERHAWVPQRAALTVAGNTVRASATATALALGQQGDRAAALISALGLDHALDRSPHTLSGGEMRRLALVSALAHGPEVLFLDEPTVGQDRRTWAAVAGVVSAAAAAGTAVVVATHDALLAALADETLNMSRGGLR